MPFTRFSSFKSHPSFSPFSPLSFGTREPVDDLYTQSMDRASGFIFCLGLTCFGIFPLPCCNNHKQNQPPPDIVEVPTVNIRIKCGRWPSTVLTLSAPPPLDPTTIFPARRPGADNTGTLSPYLLRSDTLGSRRVRPRLRSCSYLISSCGKKHTQTAR